MRRYALAALRRVILVAVGADLEALRREVAAQSLLWSLLALEREAQRWREGDTCASINDRIALARADLDSALDAHGRMER